MMIGNLGNTLATYMTLKCDGPNHMYNEHKLIDKYWPWVEGNK